MFFSKILLWIILNNIHFHGTFYIIKPLTHKKLDLQTPRLGERPRFGKAMPFKLMKQALARQWGKNLMDWTGKNTHLTGWEHAKNPWVFDRCYLFFPLNKKESVFFLSFWVHCNVDVWVQWTAFAKVDVWFSFWDSDGKCGSSMSDRISSLKLYRCGNQKSGASLTKDHFNIFQPTKPLPKTESGYHEASLSTIETATATTWGDTLEEAKTGELTFDSPSAWGAFWTSFGVAGDAWLVEAGLNGKCILCIKNVSML